MEPKRPKCHSTRFFSPNADIVVFWGLVFFMVRTFSRPISLLKFFSATVVILRQQRFSFWLMRPVLILLEEVIPISKKYLARAVLGERY